MELISCAISTVYNVRTAYAFSAYGENAFLTLQNATITLQILHYQPTLTARDSNRPKVLGVGVSMLISLLILYLAPLSTLTLLQGLTIPISAIAKVPQIVANEKNKSTGTLSALSSSPTLLAASPEFQDPLVLWGVILSSVLNVVISAQFRAYWGNTAKGKGDYRLPTEEVKVVSANGVEPHAPKAVRPLYTANLGSPEPGRKIPPAYSPARGSPAPGGGRRWARKVD
ncbi:hypothetical protein FRC04_007204 [Tulasnella sp. 424]|nr:hypothetical protein FRC04_007204 [Tulasnella sp. 424]KAG8964788.1 hypothetical protein FRC05_003578 [Tulasnella sp. 425]